MRKSLVIFSALFSLTGWAGGHPFTADPAQCTLQANQRPAPAGATWDGCVQGNGEATLEDYYLARQKDSTCAPQLASARASYNQAHDIYLADLKKFESGQLDSATMDSDEQTWRSARKAMTDLIQVCGRCVIEPVVSQTVSSPSHTEMWYLSDGSCYWGDKSPAERKAAYDALSLSLRQLRSYPKHPVDFSNPSDDGGFYSVLQFIPIDNSSLSIDTSTNLIPVDQPSYTYIAIRGFQLPNFIPLIGGRMASFSYYFQNQITQSTQDGVPYFYMQFNGIPFPSALKGKLPKIVDHTAGGETIETADLKLSRVWGEWYLSQDGYLRYRTAADFGPLIGRVSQAGQTAKDVLTDTLVQTVERVFPENSTNP